MSKRAPYTYDAFDLPAVVKNERRYRCYVPIILRGGRLAYTLDAEYRADVAFARAEDAIAEARAAATGETL